MTPTTCTTCGSQVSSGGPSQRRHRGMNTGVTHNPNYDSALFVHKGTAPCVETSEENTTTIAGARWWRTSTKRLPMPRSNVNVGGATPVFFLLGQLCEGSESTGAGLCQVSAMLPVPWNVVGTDPSLATRATWAVSSVTCHMRRRLGGAGHSVGTVTTAMGLTLSGWPQRSKTEIQWAIQPPFCEWTTRI